MRDGLTHSAQYYVYIIQLYTIVYTIILYMYLDLSGLVEVIIMFSLV